MLDRIKIFSTSKDYRYQLLLFDKNNVTWKKSSKISNN